MGIVDEDVVKVRDASDLVAIVGQYVQLKRQGRRWVGLCPFHAEKTASFGVNGELGLFKCFGCGIGGDVITFVREIEHLDFVGSVEWLAGKAGIALRYTDRAENEGRKRRARLIDAMAKAVDWYHERLLSAADGGPARGYLRSRGFERSTVDAYRIGWSPDAWDELAKALRAPDDVWRDTGLGFLNRTGRQTDAFRGRVLFPIFDANGDPVAFGGRALPGADGPKYKNSPETPIYAKSKVLYGLNWAKANVVAADEVIVCEGYTDVIGFGVAGVPRAVATCGTALTEEHVRLLRKFARRIVLAFDPDAAGQAATARFYEWEQRHELDVAVARLPAGVDPGDLAQRDPAALAESVRNALPFLGYRVERALDGVDLSHPEAKARAAEIALAAIREHPNQIVREQYAGQVAVKLGLPSQRLVDAAVRRVGKLLPVDRPAPVSTPRDTPETEALRLAIHRPEAMAPWLHECLFTDERNAAVFRALLSTTTLHDALDAADPGAAELLMRLAVEETDADPDDVAGLLIVDAGRRAAAGVRDDPRLHTWLMQQVLDARPDSIRRVEAAEQLLAWLVARSEASEDLHE